MTADRPAAVGRDPAPTIVARLGAFTDDASSSCRAYAVGGVVPSLVARPNEPAEVGAVVRAVADAGGALVPLGRGAHRELGHPPARYDVALLTERLTRVVDYTPADMTVTVGAGTTLADLAALLEREGQWLPLEPPLPAATTVGGLLATDRSGLLAAALGRVRDFVIGVGVVTAAGTFARAGGRVVKNVAGYDLMKLFVGSLGTLAVLTDVSFKVRPLPERQHAVVLRMPTIADALAFGGVLHGPLAVVAEGEVGGARATLVVRLGGSAPDVAAHRTRLLTAAARAGADVEYDGPVEEAEIATRLAALRDFPLEAPGDLVVRLTTLPDRLGALVHGLADARGGVGTWRADVPRGVVTLAIASDASTSAPMLAALVGVAATLGAHLVVERSPLAQAVDVWHPLPAAFPLMRRMKATLDPAGVLAPGRYVGRL